MRERNSTFGERTPAEDDRAVSELLGFVLTFGIILMSVGLLTVVGFGSVTDYQEHQQLQNAESAMDALAQNFEDVAKYDGINVRSGEINPRGGSLSIEEGGTLNYSQATDNVTLGRLQYEYEGTSIAYEGGGIFRSDGDGSISVRDPMLRCGDDDGIATFVVIDYETDPWNIQSGSSQMIRMDADPRDDWDGPATNVSRDEGPYNLEVTGAGDISGAWNSVLSDCEVDLVRLVSVDIYNDG